MTYYTYIVNILSNQVNNNPQKHYVTCFFPS